MFDRVHGGQQLRLFNAYYDDYGFQPIIVFDGEGRFVTALLRPGKRPSGVEIRRFVRRLVGAIRAHWPKVEILLRADSHYAAPEVFDWCRANRVDWLFGLAPNVALRRHVTALEKSTAERFRESAPAKAGVAPTRGKLRRFMQFYDAAESWSRVERIIARVEAGPDGSDTRFIVTNLEGGRAKHLYERLYCARVQTGAARHRLRRLSALTRSHPRTSCIHAVHAQRIPHPGRLESDMRGHCPMARWTVSHRQIAQADREFRKRMMEKTLYRGPGPGTRPDPGDPILCAGRR